VAFDLSLHPRQQPAERTPIVFAVAPNPRPSGSKGRIAAIPWPQPQAFRSSLGLARADVASQTRLRASQQAAKGGAVV